MLLQVLEFLSENMSKYTMKQISYNLPFNITKNTLQYLMSLKQSVLWTVYINLTVKASMRFEANISLIICGDLEKQK